MRMVSDVCFWLQDVRPRRRKPQSNKLKGLKFMHEKLDFLRPRLEKINKRPLIPFVLSVGPCKGPKSKDDWEFNIATLPFDFGADAPTLRANGKVSGSFLFKFFSFMLDLVEWPCQL